MRADQAHLRRMLERGDHDAFVRALEPLCHREVQRTAPNGLEYDDLMQEARVACLKVARAWRPDGGANPLSLAMIAVPRWLYKCANEQLAAKRRINHETLSLNAPMRSEPDFELGSVLPAGGATVHDIAEQREELREIAERLTAARIPAALADVLDSTRPSRFAAVAAAAARGDDLETGVRYRPRTPDDTAAVVINRVQASVRNQGWVVVAVTKRKLIDGRERAPQGRPTLDGRLGEPVWRVELVRATRTQEAA